MVQAVLPRPVRQKPARVFIDNHNTPIDDLVLPAPQITVLRDKRLPHEFFAAPRCRPLFVVFNLHRRQHRAPGSGHPHTLTHAVNRVVLVRLELPRDVARLDVRQRHLVCAPRPRNNQRRHTLINQNRIRLINQTRLQPRHEWPVAPKLLPPNPRRLDPPHTKLVPQIVRGNLLGRAMHNRTRIDPGTLLWRQVLHNRTRSETTSLVYF
ncbi:hypothetical protein JYS44_00485 [Phycisphaeraceae bacterium AH-315-B13]|nr:hypothetical protein [Phycisphaeraceae bacterium AH-315-B13]